MVRLQRHPRERRNERRARPVTSRPVASRVASHLALRRRLRHLPIGRQRDPRSRDARPPQRHIGDGGGAGVPSLGGRIARHAQRRRRACRDRPAPDADGAVPAAERGLCAAARQRVPADQGYADPRFPPWAATAPADDRDRDAAPGIRRSVRPATGLLRWSPACASRSAGARGAVHRDEGRGAERLGAPMRPGHTAAPGGSPIAKGFCSICSAPSSASAPASSASPPIPRSPAPTISQLRRPIFRHGLPNSSTGFRQVASSCAIRASSMPSWSGSTRSPRSARESMSSWRATASPNCCGRAP